jgi:prepilin-type N-terminal cleavage/methylation domain-containing protein/prepilin-type processing-associated H-X9-DG protein
MPCARPLHRRRRCRQRAGFTLVELLVVIGIIALLVGLLMPALGAAREQSMGLKSLSNLRQLAIGLDMYKVENKGYYPRHSSITGETTGLAAGIRRPRSRWADDIFPYMQNTEVYRSPLIPDDDWDARMKVPFAHSCDQTGATGLPTPGTIFWGGYGYNYQYLGNARKPTAGMQPFHANTSQIRKSSQTIALADTHGSRNGTANWTTEGVYSIDPPLMSVEMGSKGSRRASGVPGPGNYGYTGGNDGDPLHRATPAERNRRKVNVLFCDGHGEQMALASMDDFNGDGAVDNGWWNGLADPTQR